MNDHHIQLLGLPRVLFAHSYETRHYDLFFPAQPAFIEITHIEAGRVVLRQGEEERMFPEGSLIVTLREQPFSLMSPDPLHRHLTVGMGIPHLPMTAGQETLGLPLTLPLCREAGHREAVELLRRIVRLHGTEPEAGLALAALCMALLAELYGCSHREQSTPSSARYCQQATDYISAHLAAPIRVPDIAAHLSISPGYLSLIFRRETGETLISCVHRLRLARAKELMETKGLTLREAGEQVGIPDPGYLSRLMRRHAFEGHALFYDSNPKHKR